MAPNATRPTLQVSRGPLFLGLVWRAIGFHEGAFVVAVVAVVVVVVAAAAAVDVVVAAGAHQLPGVAEADKAGTSCSLAAIGGSGRGKRLALSCRIWFVAGPDVHVDASPTSGRVVRLGWRRFGQRRCCRRRHLNDDAMLVCVNYCRPSAAETATAAAAETAMAAYPLRKLAQLLMLLADVCRSRELLLFCASKLNFLCTNRPMKATFLAAAARGWARRSCKWGPLTWR